MSFTETEQFTAFDPESNPADKAVKPADGTEVGTPDSQKLELSEKKDEKNEKPIISPEEYKKKNSEALSRVETSAKENPDWPPAKGNPEAEKSLSANLEAGLNTV